MTGNFWQVPLRRVPLRKVLLQGAGWHKRDCDHRGRRRVQHTVVHSAFVPCLVAQAAVRGTA